MIYYVLCFHIIKLYIYKLYSFKIGIYCDHLEGWDREGGRETQEGGNMEIYVYV